MTTYAGTQERTEDAAIPWWLVLLQGIVAAFISNLPEALSSTTGLSAGGSARIRGSWACGRCWVFGGIFGAGSSIFCLAMETAQFFRYRRVRLLSGDGAGTVGLERAQGREEAVGLPCQSA